MVHSISGQNDRWAQLNAYQPPSRATSGQDSDWPSATTATPSSGSTPATPAAGGTAPTLSDGMSFALLAFNGGGTAQAAQPTGQSAAASSSDPAAATTQSGSSLGSQLLSDMQSLLAALQGTTTPSSSTTAAQASATTPTANNAAGSANGLSNSVNKDLQAVASDLDAVASASQPAGRQGAAVPGSPTSGNNISNTGTTDSGGTQRWNPGYSDGFQKQFGLAAYSAGNSLSSVASSATSSLASMNV